MKKKLVWQPKMLCPICQQSLLDEDYDICDNCFWENDPTQFELPDFTNGANHLSIVDYRKWWEILNEIMPPLMQRYHVAKSHIALWTYDELIVPRDNIKNFINELTKVNIEVRCSFYAIAEKYHYDKETFNGFPSINEKTVEENNDECIAVIFAQNPLLICEKYGLIQLKELLCATDNPDKLWTELSPNISVMPNPTHLPKRL